MDLHEIFTRGVYRAKEQLGAGQDPYMIRFARICMKLYQKCASGYRSIKLGGGGVIRIMIKIFME